MKSFSSLRRTIVHGLYWLALTVASFTQPLHSAYINVYSTTTNGAMSWTGNALGTQESLGILTDFIQATSSTSAGSTTVWQDNRSYAVLDIPAGSTILHAELIWGGTYPDEDLARNNAVEFITPDNVIHTIAPNPATFQSVAARETYVASADVTSLVNGGGWYATGHVVGTVETIPSTGRGTSACGWTLAVVYGNPNCYTNNINLYVAAEANNQTPALVTGFLTPSVNPVSARLFCSAVEGDPRIVGDNYRMGPTSPSFLLSGTNNPTNNFFASQINTILPLTTDVTTGKLIASGSSLLDTRGSFGFRNSIASPPTEVDNARHSWDITSVDASAAVSIGQTQVYAQNTGTVDVVTLSALGIQIQSSAPILVGEKTVSPSVTPLGGTLSFTVTFTNSGDLPAENAIFRDFLPAGLTLNPSSVLVDGVNIPSPDFVAGISVGTINVGQTVTIAFTAQAAAAAPAYINSALMDYAFTPFIDLPSLAGSAITNEVIATIVDQPPPLPVANDDTNTTSANIAVAGASVLGNDTGTGITAIGFTTPSTQGGAVTMATTGFYTYTPPTDFSGIDTFEYTIQDVLNRTASATVTITVFPIASNEAETITANNTLSPATSLLANDVGTGLSITAYDNPSVQGGSVSVSPEGLYTYTPPLNFSGADLFIYTITDTAGNSVSGSVAITVLPIAEDDVGSTPANTTLNGATLFSNDIGSGLVLAGYTPTTTQGGSVTVDATTGLYIYNPPLNFSGLDTFTYWVEDTEGQEAIATVRITVLPIANPDTGITPANQVFNGTTVLANDIGSGLFISSFTSASIQGGSVAFNTVSGTYTYTPPANFSGVDSFTYQIQDGNGSNASTQVTITVLPSLIDDTAYTPANTTLVMSTSVLDNDTGSTLIIAGFQTPSTQGGTVSMNTNGTYVYTPPTGFSGVDTFTYTAVDAAGNSDTATVTIFVVPRVNDLYQTTLQNTVLNGPSVLDGSVGTGLFISSYDVTSIQGGTVVMDTATGTFTYAPPLNYVGNDSFTFVATDSGGNAVTGTVFINVVPLTPTTFVGTIEHCRFLNKTDYTLISTWTASEDPSVVVYRIYYDGQLVATIPAAGPLTYITQVPSKEAAQQYQITYINATSYESDPRGYSDLALVRSASTLADILNRLFILCGLTATEDFHFLSATKIVKCFI